MGATEQAEKQFLRAIRYDSENCRAWLGLGKISADRRDYRSALKYLEHAADCDAMTGREAASLRRRIMANLCLAVLSF
jgi:Tfp pilus assembly protein PilF